MTRQALRTPAKRQRPQPQPRIVLDREITLPRQRPEEVEDGEPEEESPRGVAVIDFYV